MAQANPTQLSVIFAVRTSDGRFNSELSVPLGSSRQQYEPVVSAWLQLMHVALAATPAQPKEGRTDV